MTVVVTRWGGGLKICSPLRRRVIVNLKTDRAFRGVLWRRPRGYLVLRNVEMLRGKGEVTPMDGEVLVEAANVDFIQVL